MAREKPDGDVGFKRLYQACVFWPTFLPSYGEWICGTTIVVGNPRSSPKKCHHDLKAWLMNNKKEVDKINKEVATSKRVGSNIRVSGCVQQIWPITERNPYNGGMFGEVIMDPFK